MGNLINKIKLNMLSKRINNKFKEGGVQVTDKEMNFLLSTADNDLEKTTLRNIFGR